MFDHGSVAAYMHDLLVVCVFYQTIVNMLTVGLSIANHTPTALDGVHGIGFYSYGSATTDMVSIYGTDKVDLQLFDSGCLIDGIKNCTTVCSNTSLIWSNLAGSNPLTNFANCLVYPLVANLLADESLISPLFSEIAERFGILAVPQQTMDSINSSTQACFKAYCTDNIRCSEVISSQLSFKIPVSLPSEVPSTVSGGYLLVFEYIMQVLFRQGSLCDSRLEAS